MKSIAARFRFDWHTAMSDYCNIGTGGFGLQLIQSIELFELFERRLQAVINAEARQRAYEAPAFNIFEITRRSNFEVTTHSSFLSSLLNPLGSHRQGVLFLSAFLCWLKAKAPRLRLPDAGPEWRTSAEVAFTIPSPENPVGVAGTDPGPTNPIAGQIDLVLMSTNALIAIENKIWAAEQWRQVERYWTWLQRSSAPGDSKALIYLTRTGSPPSAYSLGEMPEAEIICMSYQTDVAEILSKCIPQIAAPAVKEVVRQYVATITERTLHMTSYDEEIWSFFSTPGRVRAYEVMAQAIERYQHLVLSRFIRRLHDKWNATSNPWGLIEQHEVNGKQYPDNGYEAFGFMLNEKFGRMQDQLWVGYSWRKAAPFDAAALAAVAALQGHYWAPRLAEKIGLKPQGYRTPTAWWLWWACSARWPNAGGREGIAHALIGPEADELARSMIVDLCELLTRIEIVSRDAE